MQPVVLAQRVAPAEGLAALAAGERPLRAVRPPVQRPAEGLAAVPALERLLARVQPLVQQQQQGPVPEGPAAHGAQVEPGARGWLLRGAEQGDRAAAVLGRALPRVQASVLEQRGPPDEALAALQARVRPLPAVQAAVLREREPAAEGLPALAALVRLLPRVDPAVGRELRALQEGLAALAALEGLLLRVDQLVSPEDGALLEGLAALGAQVGLGPGVDDLVPEQQRLVLEGLTTGTAVRSLPAAAPGPGRVLPPRSVGDGRRSPPGPPASGSRRGRLSDPPSGLPLRWGRFGLPLGRCPQTVPNNPNCLEDSVLREDSLTTASILESGHMLAADPCS